MSQHVMKPHPSFTIALAVDWTFSSGKKMSVYVVMWALSLSSHICHFLAQNVMSHIPDSLHHPNTCVLSRIDVPYLWTQPPLLYILLGTGVNPGPAGKVIPVVCMFHFPSRVTLLYTENEDQGKDLQAIVEKYLAETFHLTFTIFTVCAHVSKW